MPRPGHNFTTSINSTKEKHMDPGTGRIYPSVFEAKVAGVDHPVALAGRVEDVERISKAVAAVWSAEQKAARNAKNKAAKVARRNNR